MIPWTVAHQAPLSMEFPRQEYWSMLPFPSPEGLSNQGLNPGLLYCRQILYRLSHQGSPSLETCFFICLPCSMSPGKTWKCLIHLSMKMSKVNMDDWEEQRFSLKRQLSSFTKQPNISVQQIEVDLANAGTQFGSPDFFVLLI